jgi:hypothetical protein
METTAVAAPLLDSQGNLLRARTFSATSIHTPRPGNPRLTLCGGRVMLTSEYECSANPRYCDHGQPSLHQADLTVGRSPRLVRERHHRLPGGREASHPAGQPAPRGDAPDPACAARRRARTGPEAAMTAHPRPGRDVELKVGQEILIADVEGTCPPEPGVIVELTVVYAIISHAGNARDPFYRTSGWRAWDGELRWRLLPFIVEEAAR